MAKKLGEVKTLKIERPEKARLSGEEALRRMQEFPQRKEKFVASIRKSKD